MSRFIMIDDQATDERTAFFGQLLPDDPADGERHRLIGAVDDDGLPEGALSFVIDENMVSILHLEVYEKLRRQGIGTELVHRLLRYLAQSGLPFVVQAAYCVEPDGEGADIDAFFRSLPDFEVVSGGKSCMITPDDVRNSAVSKLLADHKCSVVPYSELSNIEKKQLIKNLKEKNLEVFLNQEGKKTVPELSLCCIRDGKCKCLVIFTESTEPDTLELSFLMADPADRKDLAGVLHEVMHRYIEQYPGHNIVFSPVNKDSELLAEHFFKTQMKTVKILTAVSFGEV